MIINLESQELNEPEGVVESHIYSHKQESSSKTDRGRCTWHLSDIQT